MNIAIYWILKFLLDLLNIVFLSFPKIISNLKKKYPENQLVKILSYVLFLPAITSFFNKKLKKIREIHNQKKYYQK